MKYRITITLKSGAFLEGEPTVPEAPLDRIQEVIADEMGQRDGALHMTLKDGTWACVRTDNIEQVRMEAADDA